VLGSLIGKEDRSMKGLTSVDHWEVPHGCIINALVRPGFLFLYDKTILKQTQGPHVPVHAQVL
jgi:hypothetical protein